MQNDYDVNIERIGSAGHYVRSVRRSSSQIKVIGRNSASEVTTIWRYTNVYIIIIIIIRSYMKYVRYEGSENKVAETCYSTIAEKQTFTILMVVKLNQGNRRRQLRP